jgi:hypothetical protein
MHGTFLEAPPRGSTGLQYTDSICGNYLYDIFAPHRHKTDKLFVNHRMRYVISFLQARINLG